MRIRQKQIVLSSPFLKEQKIDSEVRTRFLEREAKSIYAVRATRGNRFGGVSTTPRGRDLFLLVLFFG